MNPYATPVETEGSRVLPHPMRPSASTPLLTGLLYAQGVVVTGGMLAQLSSVETIFFSAPMLATTSVGLAFVGRRCSDRLPTTYGVSGIGFIAFVTLIIVANDWGPPSATVPVRLMTVCYAVYAMIVTVRFTFRDSKPADNQRLQRSGGG
ncbi:hypothetical protein N9N28_17690 [Rubripirellula amarantea]|nr:hypothetical protein [Rubripirellula amarantea]